MAVATKLKIHDYIYSITNLNGLYIFLLTFFGVILGSTCRKKMKENERHTSNRKEHQLGSSFGNELGQDIVPFGGTQTSHT